MIRKLAPKIKKTLITSLVINVSSFIYGQIILEVGDIVPEGIGIPWCGNNNSLEDSLFFDDFNYQLNNSGIPKIIVLSGFTSWCGFCQTEAPILEELYNVYADSGVVPIGFGWDWGYPYFCDSWVDEFNLTYPIVDNVDGELSDLFGTTGVPHNIVINHEMELIYSVGGYDEESLMSAISDAVAHCGEPCIQRRCSNVLGDIDYTEDMNSGQLTINIMDLLKLSDIIYFGQEINSCMLSNGDLTSDGIVNQIDLFAFATLLMEGNFEN